MDGQRFDALARLLGAPTPRRALARALLFGLAAPAATVVPRAARAQDVCHSRAPRPGFEPGVNGCGPGSVSEVVPQKYKKASFRASCNAHDRCYGTCNADRAACDRAFQLDLKRACYKAYPGREGRRRATACSNRAQRYYEAVSALGAGPYADAQAEACVCCDDPGPEFPTGPRCGEGPAQRCCEPGQACAGGECCDADRVCGAACCAPGEECCGGECRASCGPQKVWCACNRTCYDDAPTCLGACRVGLGCFAETICGPAEPGQCGG